jgi:hypothetical protein
MKYEQLTSGEPDWIRTNDPQLRRLMLYPTELPVRLKWCKYKRNAFWGNIKGPPIYGCGLLLFSVTFVHLTG